jgi:hypothetical protein
MIEDKLDRVITLLERIAGLGKDNASEPTTLAASTAQAAKTPAAPAKPNPAPVEGSTAPAATVDFMADVPAAKPAEKKPEPAAVTRADLGKLLVQLATEKGRDATTVLLKKYNAKITDDVKTADYVALAADIKQALQAK